MRKTRNKNRATPKRIGRMWWYGFGGKGSLNGFQPGIGQLKGVAADAGLANKTLLLAGLGAVGGKCLTELARMGVGTVFAVDPDIYDKESWLTQPVRRKEDLNREKAVVQGAAAAAANPEIRVITTRGFLQDLPLRILRRADLLVVAGDNLEMLVLAGKLAAALSKPLLEAAVHGESFSVFVRHWNLSDASAACPACAMSEREWGLLRSRRGCDLGTSRRLGQEATRTLPFVCSAAASLLAGEIVKCLLDDDQPRLANEELAYCLKSHRLWRTSHERNNNCRCPHEKWNIVDVDLPPSRLTFSRIIGQFADVPNFQLRGELSWISFASCGRCENWVPVRRFGNVGDRVGRCSCGAGLVAVPLGSNSEIPADDLRACRDVPLDALGLMSGDALRISSERKELCVFLDDSFSRASSGQASFSIAARGREKERGDDGRQSYC
ncbi:MAG: ThiF family adenylyltransferase [Planctomycetota bacterium]|nr:ThiF family adenylyltransferase [Planctomycetota bacterium]